MKKNRQNIRLLATLTLATFATTSAYAACKATPLAASQLNEAGLRQYLETTKAHKIGLDEFICCLPEVFSKQYFVAHSSVAAQNSIPSSPRVVTTNFTPSEEGVPELPSAFFSINGGHASLNQTHSVEAVLVDRKTGKVELYDIDFSSGSPEMSKPNPQTCVNCHGTYGRADAGGMHLIFEGPDIWPRFVGGGDVLPLVENGKTHSERDALLKRLSNASLKSLKENPRFKCLSPTVPDVRFQMELDAAVSKLNRVRVAALITQTKDYDKFKYAIAGSDVCPSMLDDVNCQLTGGGPKKKPCNAWFAPGTLNMFSDQSALRDSIRNTETAAELDRVGLELFEQQRIQTEKAIRKANSEKSVASLDFDIRARALQPRKRLLPLATDGIQDFLLRKYAVDTELYHGGIKPLTRYLFEARGIPTATWGTDIVAGYQRPAVGLIELSAIEPTNGDLRKIQTEGNLCDQLRIASVAATSKLTPATSGVLRANSKKQGVSR